MPAVRHAWPGEQLDRRAGGASTLGWGLAFGHVSLAVLAGWLAFVWLRPTDLAGDRVVVEAPRVTRISRQT